MAGKKNFKDNARDSVASVFMSKPEIEVPQQTSVTAEEKYIEYTHNTDEKKPLKKDKRLNLLINSGVYGDLKKIAFVKQTSVNNLICEVMLSYIQDNEIYLERYDSFTSNS